MWKDNMQLVILPTISNANEGEYAFLLGASGVLYMPQAYTDSFAPMHLYLISNEKIKKGDIILWNNRISEAIDTVYTESTKKVIAASDTKLILPQFTSPLLEEYVKRTNRKQSLEIEVDCNDVTYNKSSESYDIDVVYCNGKEIASFDYELQAAEMLSIINELGNQPKLDSNNNISIRFKEASKYITNHVVREAMKIVSKDVRVPKLRSYGMLKPKDKYYISSEVEQLLLRFQNDLMSLEDNEFLDIKPIGVKDWIKKNLK